MLFALRLFLTSCLVFLFACQSRTSLIREGRDSVVILTVRYANTGLPVLPDLSVGTGFFVSQDSERSRGTKNSIYSDLTTIPGNSGGPLQSARSGYVIGIQSATVTYDSARVRFGVAAKGRALLEMIGAYNSQLQNHNSNASQ